MKFSFGRTLRDCFDSSGTGAVWSQVFPFISKCPRTSPHPTPHPRPLQLRKRGCFLKGHPTCAWASGVIGWGPCAVSWLWFCSLGQASLAGRPRRPGHAMKPEAWPQFLTPLVESEPWTLTCPQVHWPTAAQETGSFSPTKPTLIKQEVRLILGPTF